MKERLTEYFEIGNYTEKQNIIDISDKLPLFENGVIMGKAINKLAEFEDFLEEHDCETLTDYTKQVRKEVCEEIREKVKKLIDKDFKLCNHEYANGYCYGLQYDLAKILDQIQGEEGSK